MARALRTARAEIAALLRRTDRAGWANRPAATTHALSVSPPGCKRPHQYGFYFDTDMSLRHDE